MPGASFENILLSTSLKVSGNNLSAAADKFVFCKLGVARDTVVPCASGDLPLGVNQATEISGRYVPVAHIGISKIRLAGVVKRGDMLKPTSGAYDGRAIKAGTTDTSVGAMAMQSGSTGEVIAALLTAGVKGGISQVLTSSYTVPTWFNSGAQGYFCLYRDDDGEPRLYMSSTTAAPYALAGNVFMLGATGNPFV